MDFLLQVPTVHYCEMALNAIIARPWYALSNIAFLIVGSVILRQGGQHSKAFGGLALLIGTLSFVYDSTFTYLSQLFDLSGMLLLIGYLLYLNLSHVVPRRLLKQLLLVGFVAAWVRVRDRAHRWWRSFLSDLAKYCPDTRTIGWTGTPFRGNGVWLTAGDEPLFTNIATRVTMRELLDLGFLSPLVTNQTEEGRQKNRRVEVIVTSTR